MAKIEKNPLSTLQLMASSCSGAIITTVFMTPFDVVKVRLQAQQRLQLKQKCFLYCNGLMDHLCSCAVEICDCATSICTNPKHGSWFNRPVPLHLNGTWDAFFKISRAEGIASLWSAVTPTLFVAIPNTIIYFTSYEQMRITLNNWYISNNKEVPLWTSGVVGAVARIWAATVISPIELARTKMQATPTTYKELYIDLRRHVKLLGYRSLWSGLVPTLLRDVPFSGLYWFSYENLKRSFNQETPSTNFSLFAGGFSGAIAGCLTLPLDVVKTHQQIQIGESELFTDRPTKGSGKTWPMLVSIYQQQGVPGLFSGLVPRLAKVVPACAIMITTFEYAKKYFNNKNERELT